MNTLVDQFDLKMIASNISEHQYYDINTGKKWLFYICIVLTGVDTNIIAYHKKVLGSISSHGLSVWSLHFVPMSMDFQSQRHSCYNDWRYLIECVNKWCVNLMTRYPCFLSDVQWDRLR